MRIKLRIALVLLLASSAAFCGDESVYQNPVDGKAYLGDWETYKPRDSVAEQTGRVVNLGIRLLSTQVDFANNVATHDLAAFIKSIQDTLVFELGPRADTGGVML